MTAADEEVSRLVAALAWMGWLFDSRQPRRTWERALYVSELEDLDGFSAGDL